MATTATDSAGAARPSPATSRAAGEAAPGSVARALFAPVDAASLVAFRILFGVTMVIAVVRFFAHGWIDEYFVAPSHFFPYEGFEWVRPWPRPLMYAHFAVMGLAAACIACGVFYRASAAVFCALFTYAHLIDKTHYLNHYYLVSLLALLMVVLPLGSVGSVDAWKRRAPPRSSVPAWALWAIRFQVGVVYFFGGAAKLGSDWLVHAQPLTIWLRANHDVPVVGHLLGAKATAYAFSYAGAAFDLAIVPLLLWPRSRPVAFVALAAFHLVTARLFHLGIFPWLMTASALVFFPPDWPRHVLARLRISGASPSVEPADVPAPSRGTRTAILGALALHAAIQLVVPLRAAMHPGNVLWTERGFRFSWRVMVMEKNGVVELTATEPSTGRSWAVSPREYLSAQQSRMMSTQPDMIRQLAVFVADDFRARGHRDIEVHARADVSLNGRPAQPLIDPGVDLAQPSDTLDAHAWILPLPDGVVPRY
jgi:vitamin K-dependent gamma-carboxylase